MISVPLSLISLAFAAMKAYFSQRTHEFSDPNPAIIKNIFFMYPFFLILTFAYVITWALIFAYVKAYVVAMIATTILINLILVKVLKVDNPR